MSLNNILWLKLLWKIQIWSWEKEKAIRGTLIFVKVKWEKVIVFDIFGRLELKNVATDKLFLLTIQYLCYKRCICGVKGVFMSQRVYLWRKGLIMLQRVLLKGWHCTKWNSVLCLHWNHSLSTINHIVHSNSMISDLRLELRSVATDKLFLWTILCLWYRGCICGTRGVFCH